MPVLSLAVPDEALLPIADDVCASLQRMRPDTDVKVVHGSEGDVLLEPSAHSERGLDEVLAVLRRFDPRDGLLVTPAHAEARAEAVLRDPSALHPADPLRAVGHGARLAASGALRIAQLRASRPDLRVVPFPGTDDELVAAWPDEAWDGALLGCDALDRAARLDDLRRRLDEPWIGAAGAGALWLSGSWDEEMRELLLPLDDRPTRLEVTAEHAVARALQLPPELTLGVRVRASQSRLEANALVMHPESLRSMRANRQGEATMRGCWRLASMLARDLVERGAITLADGPVP